MRYLLFTSIAFSLLAVACEEPFELESSIPSELVVESQLRAGSKPIVNLSAVNSLGELQAAGNLGNSYVSLRNSDGRTFVLDLATVADNSASFTTSENEIIISGVTYNLEISAPGYAKLQSRTTVPSVAQVGLPAKAEGMASSQANGTASIVVPITIRDLSDRQNYYHVLVWAFDRAVVADEDASKMGIPVIFEFTNAPTASFQMGSAGWLFSGESFSQGIFTNQLALTAHNLRAMQQPTLSIEVRTVSLDYYSYFLQQPESSTIPIPKLGSIIANDNIANGAGVFGSYAVEESIVEISF